MIKKILSQLSIIFMTCIGCIVFYLVLFMNSAPPRLLSSEDIKFLVQPGWSTKIIARNLYERQIIRSPIFFRILTRIFRKDNSISSGVYLIKSNASTYDVFKLLVSGKIMLEKITIPEGLTSQTIAKILKQSKIIDSEQEFLKYTQDTSLLQEFGIFADTAEGLLFPSTYMFEPGYPARKVVYTLIKAFYKNIQKIHPNYQTMNWSDFYNKIVLSSIIEKEYRVDDEAPLIASVFYNRLQSNIALESCASVIYVLTNILNRPHPKRLFYSDLEIDHPHNTYRNKGLPPSPISNPGYVALEATFKPAKTNYLFFVVDNPSKGTHKFSSSITEHEESKRQYIETYFPK